MEMLLKLSLKIEDAQKQEESLRDLKKWLEHSGVRVEWIPGPPVEGELGTKVFCIIYLVVIAGSLNEGMHEALEPIHRWAECHQTTPVLHLSGQEEIDKPICDHLERNKYHIEVEKPEIPPKEKEKPGVSPPPTKGKEQPGASPPLNLFGTNLK